jgi:hypothetical protein
MLECTGFVRRRTEGGWATLILDLSGSEDEILGGFRPTTRHCIRKSRESGVQIEVSDGPDGWSALSSLQNNLALRAPVPRIDEAGAERISRFWLRGGTGGTLLVASYEEEILAAALIIAHQGTAHLMMMPSAHRRRELSSSHLLLWEAMRWAKEHGCSTFDFGGYSLVAKEGDSLAGVNLFKRGFASLDHLSRSVAVHDMVCSGATLAIAGATMNSATWVWRRLASGKRQGASGRKRTWALKDS